MLRYKTIEIFTNEESRDKSKLVADAVVRFVHDLKIAARCMVTRGVAGCYESGEVATRRLEVLSYNLPLRITIVLPAAEAERVLAGLDGIVGEGIVAVQDLAVVSHRVHNAFFPRQLMVRDVMTTDVKRVNLSGSLSDAVRLLLRSVFSGLPVVDDRDRPVGVITRGDLIRRGGLPLRLGLLAESEANRLDIILDALKSRRAADVMTSPPITIHEDRPLAEAVDLMLKRQVKRLPVVGSDQHLTGMLSRLDIFRTVMREAPDWRAFRAQQIDVRPLKTVGDILRRDTLTVSPETSIETVIQIIDSNDLQRAAVIDSQGRLLGLISDRDLLRYFKQDQEGIWNVLTRPLKWQDCSGDLRQCLAATKAGEVMTTELVTVREDMTIDHAIRLMTEKALKRLPVVDDDGRFKGMISRDSLLRTGFGLHGKTVNQRNAP